MNAALGGLGNGSPVWQTLMQLLRTAIDNAHINAEARIPETNELAGYTGGGAHLRMFHEELINRRGIGRDATRPGPAKSGDR